MSSDHEPDDHDHRRHVAQKIAQGDERRQLPTRKPLPASRTGRRTTGRCRERPGRRRWSARSGSGTGRRVADQRRRPGRPERHEAGIPVRRHRIPSTLRSPAGSTVRHAGHTQTPPWRNPAPVAASPAAPLEQVAAPPGEEARHGEVPHHADERRRRCPASHQPLPWPKRICDDADVGDRADRADRVEGGKAAEEGRRRAAAGRGR